SPQVKDSGIYECQINTKPTKRQFINLQVLEPRSSISEGRELYLDRGSTLSLTCNVHNTKNPPEYISWYHGNKVARFEEPDMREKTVLLPNVSYSTLILDKAKVHNSGTYTCSPSNANEASIRVHVLSG
ncbi:unnamed protein product, partial [Meganyctiphanes norvegica]